MALGLVENPGQKKKCGDHSIPQPESKSLPGEKDAGITVPKKESTKLASPDRERVTLGKQQCSSSDESKSWGSQKKRHK